MDYVVHQDYVHEMVPSRAKPATLADAVASAALSVAVGGSAAVDAVAAASVVRALSSAGAAVAATNGDAGASGVAAVAGPATAPATYPAANPSHVSTGPYVVKLRGLPWQSTNHDIEQFFQAKGATPLRVVIVYNAMGRPSGHAYVEFGSQRELDIAVGMNRDVLGGRYIEVFVATYEDMLSASTPLGGPQSVGPSAASNGFGGAGYVPRPSSGTPSTESLVIRLRGLPFS